MPTSSYRLSLPLLALLLLLLTPLTLAEPENLEPLQQSLLGKTLLDEGDIPALIRLHQAGRAGFEIHPELRLPEPWQNLLSQSFARMQVALLLENYQALLKECQRAEWLSLLALAMQRSFPETAQSTDEESLQVVCQLSQAFGVFARRKLRLLDPDELARLEGNPMFAGTPTNRAELHLLAARAYLDQGESAAFEESLARLKSYLEGPDPSQTMLIGYHCLARHSRHSSASLEEAVSRVLSVAKSYRPGANPTDDVFWITTGDEVMALFHELVSSYHMELDVDRKETLRRQLNSLYELSYSWLQYVIAAEPSLFQLDSEIFFGSGFEKRQGMFALFLTSQKIGALVQRHIIDRNDPSAADAVRTDLRNYQAYREALRGFWLDVPERFFPTRGDFWNGSSLHRIEVGLKVQLWILEPSKDKVQALTEEVLSLSPLEHALELAVAWSDSLRKVDPEGVEQLLRRAQQMATEYRLPAYALLLAEQRVLSLDLHQRTPLAVEVAEQAIAASRDLIAPSTPMPGGRTMGEVIKALSEFVALRSLEVGDTTSALRQLNQGEALKSALQLSQNASRSEGEVAARMKDVRQARAEQDRLARSDVLSEGSSTLASNKGDFLNASRELQATYPELYDRTLSIKPLEFPRLQKHLSEDVVLLQYFPTDSKLFIFAVTSDRLRLEQVELKKAELDQMVVGYLRAVRRVARASEVAELSTRLHARLIAPVEKELAGKSTVLLVPTGRLNYLPFASLSNEKAEPLAEKYRMSLLGKSSDLVDVLLEKPAPGGAMVVLADPAGDLPAARQEGEALAALFPGGVALFREEATIDALGKGLADHPYLHLATHGEIDPADPSLSYLVLGQGQKLRSEDIFSLPLEAVQMVTLSACNTALGQAEPTASVVSLAESFWVTGPDTVVATLWAVNDASTEVFMKQFYTAIRDGAGKAEALQRAQTTLRKSVDYSHPYYWAPFVLLGDWR